MTETRVDDRQRALIDMCLNCKKVSCRQGICDAYKQACRDNRRSTGIKPKLYKLDGEWHTLREWAKIKGVRYDTLRSRVMVHGWPLAEAISPPPGKCAVPGKRYTVAGRTLDLREWAEALGIGYTALTGYKNRCKVSAEAAIAHYLTRGKRGT